MKNAIYDAQIFITTNGKTTYKFALKCLMKQSLIFPIVKFKNMTKVDALCRGVDKCKTKYFIVCDDDMLLHHYSVEFMIKTFIQQELVNEKLIMIEFPLWEHLSRKLCFGGIKIYRTKYVKDIGGFKANKNGKIDKIFQDTAKNYNYRIIRIRKQHGLVSIHSIGTLAEQIYYSQLWGWKRHDYRKIKKYTSSVKSQYGLTKQFLYKLNQKRKSDFGNFMRKKKERT